MSDRYVTAKLAEEAAQVALSAARATLTAAQVAYDRAAADLEAAQEESTSAYEEMIVKTAISALADVERGRRGIGNIDTPPPYEAGP